MSFAIICDGGCRRMSKDFGDFHAVGSILNMFDVKHYCDACYTKVKAYEAELMELKEAEQKKFDEKVKQLKEKFEPKDETLDEAGSE